MSYMDRFRYGKTGKVTSVVLESAGEMAVGWGLGYVQGRYREKAMFMGLPVDLLAGIVGKGAGLGMALTGKGPGWLKSAAGTLGTAGLIAYAHTHGAGVGSQKSGVKRVLVQDKDLDKVRKLAPDSVVLGAISPAPHGDMLSRSELEKLAR